MKGRGERRDVAASLSLLLLFAIPLDAQQPFTAFQDQKARVILRTQLACLGCHELDGDGGRTAPSLTTVRERRSAAYIRAMIEDPQRRLPGAAMPRTPMPAATRELIVRFFARGAVGPDVPPVAAAPPGGATPDAATLYARWCAGCHGSTGRGDAPNARFLPVPPALHASAERMRERPDDSLYDTIAGGGVVMGKSARMPAFGATLSREEIRSLVAYIRGLCRCTGPSWSRDGKGG